MKANQSTLDKIEDLFKALGYKVRYERGNFKHGSCVLLASKVVVVNKFATTDVKVAALAEIIAQLTLDLSNLEEAQVKFLNAIQQESFAS